MFGTTESAVWDQGSSMGDRSISNPQRRWLREELQSWQAAGVLSSQQADQILSQYQDEAEASQQTLSRASWVLQAISAILVFLALLLLIGYNWAGMPDAVKLALIFSVVIGTYAAAFHLRFSRKAKLASEIAFFLGGLTYGAAIFLIAQIFHINAHFPDGFLWWSIGIVPLAIGMHQNLLHLLLAWLLTIWSGIEIFVYGQGSPWRQGPWRDLPNVAILLPIMVLPALLIAHRRNTPWPVFFYAAALGWWLMLQPYAWGVVNDTLWMIGTVGAMMWIVAEAHFLGDRRAIPYRALGILLLGGVLLFLSSYEGTESLFMNSTQERLGPGIVAVIAALVAGTFFAVESVRRRALQDSALQESAIRKSESSVAQGDWKERQWLPLSLAGAMGVMAIWTTIFASPGGWSGDQPKMMVAIVPTILANFAILVVAVWLVRLGVREGRTRPFAAGVLGVLHWAWIRYIDLFGELGGMLGASLMFLFSAVVLFAVSWYWRGRKGVGHA
jgi:uncharacterized membrane protein